MINFPIFVGCFTTFLNISTKACWTRTFFTSYLLTIPCRRTLTLNISSLSRAVLLLETTKLLSSCYFRRMIMAYAAVKRDKYNCCGPPAFESQRVGYQFNQKSLITISIQNTYSIHKFILKIQEILKSHEQKGQSHF